MTQGDGLGSQESRCREYASYKDHTVADVFKDDITGKLAHRPGMEAMLTWLRAHRRDNPVVIIDDISRLARGLEAHLALRTSPSSAGGRLESPSIEFGEDSDSILVENLLASVAQHQREKNGEQTKNRMRGRVMNGYWVFRAPIGYRYEKTGGHGKLLVRDEPHASILQEALEGFASGRFASQAEVKRFLESRPEYPKELPNGEIRAQRVTDLLTRSVYTGYVEAPNWDVSLRKGHHEGLISFESFQRIQERMSKPSKAPARKDINADFPLRGFVMCDDCDKPMTSCWSKGATKHYPYYLCDTKGCASYRKSISRAKIEDGFEGILQALQPTKQLFSIARAMFADVWDMRLAQAQNDQKVVKKQLCAISKQVESLLNRIVDATNASVISAYETRIEKLEREKILLAEKADKFLPPKGRLEEFIELSLRFLANPYDIYINGGLALKKTVQRLAFAQPLRYSRETGYRTTEITLPFKVLGSFNNQKCEMVRPRRLELPRVLPHSDLNAARLPIPPRPHSHCLVAAL